MKHLKNKEELSDYLSLGTRIVNEKFGPLKGANGNARILGPCGDTMEFWVYIEKEIIRDVRYTTDGCYHSNKCGSTAATLALGCSAEVAEGFSQDDVLSAAGDIANESSHCGLLAANTLRAAITDWRKNKKQESILAGKKKEISAQSIIKPREDLIVSFRSKEGTEKTVGAIYAGTFSDEPPMILVSVDPTAKMTSLINQAGCFVLNFSTSSQREYIKYLSAHPITDRIPAKTSEGLKVNSPILGDCPVNIECTVFSSLSTGSREMLIARVECVHTDVDMVKADGTVDWEKLERL